MKKKDNLVSVIIINYNNKKFLKRSIESVLNQTYTKIELIVVDNNSNDGSLEIIKNYKKKIRFISNKRRVNHGSYNQIHCIEKALKKIRGKIIFFLDSDDFFMKNKVEIIMKKFCKSSENLIFDKSINYYNKRNKKKIHLNKRTNIITPWPRFYPQSCISIRKNYLMKIYPKIKINNYPNVWFDFRVAMQTYLLFGKIHIIEKFLTNYQQSNSQISSKFKKFSKNWWKRRNQAHEFTNYLYKKNSIKKNKNLDEYLTNFINKLLK
tara:strand:+ start:111 stop:905 length:795 start_codon:yes stop_codon:yes gene_type:complete